MKAGMCESGERMWSMDVQHSRWGATQTPVLAVLGLHQADFKT